MSDVRCQILVILASIFALGFALTSQYGFGYHPCEMCIWQRWGYGAVIVFGLLSFKVPNLFNLAIAALVATCAIAFFHFGVEQKLWQGFTACTSELKADNIEDLKQQIMNAPVVRCDQATWVFLGLSMAGWNVLYSGALSIYAIKSQTKSIFNRRRAG
jgi:disulfide bond formation protein DsbB